MPIKSLVYSNETKTLNVQMAQQHSFINARNRLVGAAKQHVKKNGLAKSNILGVISQNKFISQNNSRSKLKTGRRFIREHKNTIVKQVHLFKQVNNFKPVNNFKHIHNKAIYKFTNKITNMTITSNRPTTDEFINNNQTKQPSLPSNTYRIYILCYNKERFEKAKTIYGIYSWAFPILMKYQDYTFENAFWKQLLEIKSEWINYKFVGTMSYKAYEKVNIDDIDRKIIIDSYKNKCYVHFADGTTPVLNSPLAAKHPNFKRIWVDVLEKLNLNDSTESLFNYFMCTPTLMVLFLNWYSSVYLPVLMSHPLMFTNANYTEGLGKDALVKLWGHPYYPHLPFVMERLNKCFFQDILNQVQNISFMQSKIAFLFIIPDNKSICGGIRTLLNYINYLNNLGYNIDIYFGNCLMKHLSQINLHYLINNIKIYNINDISKNNFYLGLQLKRDYDVIVANAWQISDAVYAQRHKAKHLAYIIQDREELFYPNDINLQKRVKHTYKPEYNYYCLSKYLATYFKNMFPNGKVTDSILGFDSRTYFIKNMSATRINSIVIAYYTGKPGRLPGLVEKIILILCKKYKCYIYPDIYKKTTNGNIINCGNLSIEQLNDLYNNNKVGIVFSNTNPSRLGFEMVASGLNVIEYASEFTQYDLDPKYFTLIKNEQNIMSIVDNLMNKSIDLKQYDIYKKHHNNETEKEIICDFFKKLL